MSDAARQLTVVIPALNEAGNIGELIVRCKATLAKEKIDGEIIVVDGGSADGTADEARDAGAEVVVQQTPGYGGALREGFSHAHSPYILTMDSDLSHEPEVIARLWEARERADVIIASRYVPGGRAEMSAFRAVLSRILNFIFTRALDIPVKDISSGFRLYRREVVKEIEFHAQDFDVLEEILILICNRGWSVTEIPFDYRPRREGKSHAKLFKFGVAYCRTLFKMRKLRRRG
ncbi:glycosyltransferase family 2 protein [Candidatus Sumerlaeota bacterium]|nr:glycosyltransferase family 2 protein [Candidatus Sumerlaeota bacterium]MBI3736970.1 glycosyltransferase family 2 protein [Candidatus Sumerlaeota bacterium]